MYRPGTLLHLWFYRDFIQAVMHEVAPEGFTMRKPTPRRTSTSAIAPTAGSSSTAVPTSTTAPELQIAEDPSSIRTTPTASTSQVHQPPSVAAIPLLIGPNERWCADHHSKLSKIGMEIYGIRDKASGKWLGLWAIPNIRVKQCLAYLYLCVVEAYGGVLIFGDLHRVHRSRIMS